VPFDYDKTQFALERFRDDERFEEFALILLADIEPTVRPIGGSGDRARDGAGGLFAFGEEDELIVMVSLEAKWDEKIRGELRRVAKRWNPKRVIAVTNRKVTNAKREALEEDATTRGWHFRVYGQKWLAQRLHLSENIELRRDFLGLDRPRPPFFLSPRAYRQLLAGRRLLDVEFINRQRELEAARAALDDGAALLVIEADGGIGKSRFVLELAEREGRRRRWFFAPYGLEFDASRINELSSGRRTVVVVDDAHRRDDLGALLAALERRTPIPQIVLVTRPGHRDQLLRKQVALTAPKTIKLGPLDRPEIVALLTQPPLSLTRQGMLTTIVTLSGGNPQIALIAGRLAARGVHPHEFSDAALFRQHVESLLAASLDDNDIARDLLAIIAALGGLDTSDAPTIELVCELAGVAEAGLRRLLISLAEAGLVVEEGSDVYTTKPDVLREQVLRFSFFDQERRPRLPYPRVYGALAPLQRSRLLAALGEAHVGDLPRAADALRSIRSQLLAAVHDCAPSALIRFVRLAESLGAGVPKLSLDLVDAVCARADFARDAELGLALVAATGRAKFGDFVRGWQTLLALGDHVFPDADADVRVALTKEIAEAYGCCPVDHSPDDPKILAGVQGVMRIETDRFLAQGITTPGRVMTAAVTARALLAMTFEKQQADAADVMRLHLYGVGVPATESTRQTLVVGARLFRETLLDLPPRVQLEQLEPLRELVQVAAGHSGLFGYQPGHAERELAETVLHDEIEPWLRENIDEFALPVAAEVLDHFAWRRHGGRAVKGPRLSRRLREYIDLVHPGSRLRPRLDFEREAKREAAHVERYARQLAWTRNAEALIERWNDWVGEALAVMDKLPWHHTLPLTLARAAELSPPLGRRLATKIVEGDLALRDLSRPLLAAVAAAADPEFVGDWAESERVELRRAAVAATRGLRDDDARAVLAPLAADADASVRAAVFDELLWSRRPLTAWVLDTALELAREGGLSRLEYILGRLRVDADEEKRAVELPAHPRDVVSAILLETAAGREVPRHHTVRSTLELAVSVGLDLTMSWVYARLAYLEREAANQAYLHVLPDELATLLPLERARPDWARDLHRLAGMYETDSLHWTVRESLRRAISWLGGDTPELTAILAKWAGDEVGLTRATDFLAVTTDWTVFTERARLLLANHPHDPRLQEAIVQSQHPEGFTSGGETFRERAEQFASWVNDPALAVVGAEGRDEFNALADEAIETDRRERQGFA
jgi:hypothetical protein